MRLVAGNVCPREASRSLAASGKVRFRDAAPATTSPCDHGRRLVDRLRCAVCYRLLVARDPDPCRHYGNGRRTQGGLWLIVFAAWAMLNYNIALLFIGLGISVIFSAFVKPGFMAKPQVDNTLE
jgi:hypothetical protein